MWNDSPGKSYHRIKSSAWLRRVVIILPYHPCGWIRDFVVESSCQGFGEWAKTVGNLGWPDIDGGSSLGSDPWLRNGCKSLIQQMNDIQGWHGYNQGLCFWTFWLACFRKVIAPAMRTGDVSFLQKLGQKFCKTSFQSFFLSNHFSCVTFCVASIHFSQLESGCNIASHIISLEAARVHWGHPDNDGSSARTHKVVCQERCRVLSNHFAMDAAISWKCYLAESEHKWILSRCCSWWTFLKKT